MELQGAIEALTALLEPCEVEFFTDSQYVKNGVTGWMKGWKRNGWRTAAKLPVKNKDLWRALDEQSTRHKVSWSWVKGHAGHDGNERCDQLATAAAEKVKQKHTPQELKERLAQFERGAEMPAAIGS